MAKKRRFDFTKKNKRSGKVENVGYLDLEQDEEQSRCSLYFYGDIVSATWESMWYEEDRCPQDIADFLNQLDGYEDIDIYFNSGGGDVFAGLAIYNQLKRYDGHKVGYVDGMAASIASVIMFACDELHFATVVGCTRCDCCLFFDFDIEILLHLLTVEPCLIAHEALNLVSCDTLLHMFHVDIKN